MTVSGPAIALRTQIIAHIVRRITGGEWPVGAAVPSESALMRQFGASRMTVHHAVRDLTSRGFLVRRKGSGTFVAPPRPYASRYEHLDIIAEIRTRGGVHSADVLHREMRLPTTEEQADFAADRPLFHAIVLHREDGLPVELEDRLLDPLAMPNCAGIDLTQRTLFSVLMLIRPYREGSETVRPLLCTPDERRLLAVDADSAALEIRRRTWTDEGVITSARLLRVRAAACLEGTIASDDRHAALPI